MPTILTAKNPIREPFWKYLGFGTVKAELERYDFLRTRCSYVNKKTGKLQWPHLYQIESKKALSRPYPRHGRLIIIPIKDWEIVDEND